MTMVRPPAVAGFFYPADADELSREIARHLDSAPVPATVRPKAIVVPHAGYVYSAGVAAPAYSAVRANADAIRRVVLLGPAHRVAVPGLAAPTATRFRTPLGDIRVDVDAIDRIADLPQVERRDDTHREEHALEVQLPFLQSILDDFALVPLVVGSATPEQIAEVLERLWGGPETLIVISSDLSHYLGYDEAQRIDRRTADAIEALNGDALGPDQACGRLPIAGLLRQAKRRNLSVIRLSLRNSGDTAGPKDRVVGYGSWAFRETPGAGRQTADDDPEAAIAEHGTALLESISPTLRYAIRHGKAPTVDLAKVPAPLRQHAATFVTLRHGKDLRGCVGTVDPIRPLAVDVVENTYGAAFKDPRFGPLQRGELTNLKASISLLSVPAPIEFADEVDLLSQLRIGQDGLVLRSGQRRALFLPQVWKDLTKAETFLSHLKTKAGIERSLERPQDQALRFTSTTIGSVSLDVTGRGVITQDVN
ncbi:MAG: AmmeMemoRadiSam system protein B [Alphaproteobacteria bacterium]|nr:AmmeMemoRadiSam system protein B [Alphaproteobacteria bacterium]